MKLWMVTCDYLAGNDYGINLGLVGIYDTREAATKAHDETLKLLETAYSLEDDEDRNELECYVTVLPVETNQTHSCIINPYGMHVECYPDVRLGSYIE